MHHIPQHVLSVTRRITGENSPGYSHLLYVKLKELAIRTISLPSSEMMSSTDNIILEDERNKENSLLLL